MSNGAQPSARKNFKVVVRARPPLERELHPDYREVIQVNHEQNGMTIAENFDDPAYAAHTFTFDHVYDQDCDQKCVYETTAKEAVLSTLEGYNATILAYGQTGTGKTYTMEGFDDAQNRGIIPRAVEELFDYIHNVADSSIRFLVRASFLQIYNENISDLLKPQRTNLAIRSGKKKGVFVEGLSEWVVRNPREVYGLIKRGAQIRATSYTRMNAVSSRSHAIFILIVEQNEVIVDPDNNDANTSNSNIRETFKVGKLNLVDLAGSERVSISGAVGRRLEESKKINQSLSALGNVIAALTDKNALRSHIPYRDSKLTRILEDSLGGNCKTTMMAMVSPAIDAFLESLSTLKFANRAKNIKNRAQINEDLDEKALLRRYEQELKRLRQELNERSKNVVDKRKLIEVEEMRKRAEQDKLAALMNMEQLSRDLMQEKISKKKLEARIKELNGNLIVGGRVQDTPAFKQALQQEQARVHKAYIGKVQELEKEREAMEQEKEQTERYKQLLLKQRDIMVQLTARLNERDQSIVALQEELEAYDSHQRMMEDALDQKTATLIHLQKSMLDPAHSQPELPQLDRPQTPQVMLQPNVQTPRPGAQSPALVGSGQFWGRDALSEMQISIPGDPITPARALPLTPHGLGAGRGLGADVFSARSAEEARIAIIEEENHMLRARLREMPHTAEHYVDVEDLARKNEAFSKERGALTVILENKMKVLVDRIATSMTQAPEQSNSRTLKEVGILQRLLSASIQALKQSDEFSPAAREPSSTALHPPSTPRAAPVVPSISSSAGHSQSSSRTSLNSVAPEKQGRTTTDSDSDGGSHSWPSPQRVARSTSTPGRGQGGSNPGSISERPSPAPAADKLRRASEKKTRAAEASGERKSGTEGDRPASRAGRPTAVPSNTLARESKEALAGNVEKTSLRSNTDRDARETLSRDRDIDKELDGRYRNHIERKGKHAWGRDRENDSMDSLSSNRSVRGREGEKEKSLYRYDDTNRQSERQTDDDAMNMNSIEQLKSELQSFI